MTEIYIGNNIREQRELPGTYSHGLGPVKAVNAGMSC